MISIFPPKPNGKRGFRVWNPQLQGFAGYQQADGTVIGDPANAEFTEVCINYGWIAGGGGVGRPGPFDLLPLLLEAPGHNPELFELPPDVRNPVLIEHVDYPELAKLQLQWYTLPALAAQVLDLGGLVYSCAPFNGWYQETEISRNLLDKQRYNLSNTVVSAFHALFICCSDSPSLYCQPASARTTYVNRNCNFDFELWASRCSMRV
jgi:nitric oxide synthase oxygenase domain/subunit